LRPGTAEPGYLTLGEALARGLTRVTEVSEGGSVPQLLFINDAMRPVLLLDGEELVGAELFDSPRTFARLLPKLVRSYGHRLTRGAKAGYPPSKKTTSAADT
jgi:hypothetical protein